MIPSPRGAVGGRLGPVDAPDTVTEAIAFLHDAGYDLDLQLVDGNLVHDSACVTCRTEDAVVERLFRFEGPSDPGDEMIVLGVRDPHTGRRGVVASAYGPAADPEIIEHLHGLASRHEP